MNAESAPEETGEDKGEEHAPEEESSDKENEDADAAPVTTDELVWAYCYDKNRGGYWKLGKKSDLTTTTSSTGAKV